MADVEANGAVANGGSEATPPHVPVLKRLATATKEGAAAVSTGGARFWDGVSDRLESLNYRAEKSGERMNAWAAGNRVSLQLVARKRGVVLVCARVQIRAVRQGACASAL